MRLRELERAGLLERIQEVGRREVRYSLTAKGRELGPVIAALNFWGVHNAISALQPDEQVTSARMIESLRDYLVTKRVQPSRPLALALCFGEDERAVLRFDGRQWFRDPWGAPADVTVATPHASWVALFVSKPVALLATLGVDGEAWAIDERERFSPACCVRRTTWWWRRPLAFSHWLRWRHRSAFTQDPIDRIDPGPGLERPGGSLSALTANGHRLPQTPKRPRKSASPRVAPRRRSLTANSIRESWARPLRVSLAIRALSWRFKRCLKSQNVKAFQSA